MKIRASRVSTRVFLFLALIAALPLSVAAKDLPEASLVKDGRLYEAILLLEKKPKDLEAQKRAAELCLKLALYERAEARLLAAGETAVTARERVVAEALAQGNRAAALRLAGLAGGELERKTQVAVARLELAEGRAMAALERASKLVDAELVAAAASPALTEALECKPIRIGMSGSKLAHVGFSSDGRFLALWSEDFGHIEIRDLQAGLATKAVPLRAVAPGMRVEALAMSADGRFLAMIGRVKAKSGKESLSLRIERLDTGAEVRSLALGSKFPQGPIDALVYAGDRLCGLSEKNLFLFDPLSGALAASALLPMEAWTLNYLEAKDRFILGLSDSNSVHLARAKDLVPTKEKPEVQELSLARRISRLGKFFYDPRRQLYLYLSASSGFDKPYVAPSELGSGRTYGYPSDPLDSKADGSYANGQDGDLSPKGDLVAILTKTELLVSPFPFLDRLESAAEIAKLGGKGEEFFEAFLNNSWKLRYDVSMENLLVKAGCGERSIALYRAEELLDKGQLDAAAKLFASIGETAKAAQLASQILKQGLERYELGSLDASYERARAIYDAGKMDPAPLIDETLPLALKRSGRELPFNLYLEKGQRAEAEALLFTKDSYTDRRKLLPLAAKLGITEAQFYEQLVKIYEEAGEWQTAAEIHLQRGDDAKLRQALKKAFETEHWTSGILDIVLKRGDPALSKSVAEWMVSAEANPYWLNTILDSIQDRAFFGKLADKVSSGWNLDLAAALYERAGTRPPARMARLLLVRDQVKDFLVERYSYLSVFLSDRFNRVSGKELGALPAKPRSAELLAIADYYETSSFKTKNTDIAISELERAKVYLKAAELLKGAGF